MRGPQLRGAAVARASKYVEDPLSEALIQGGIQRPATLQIYVAGEGLAFRPVVEATPVFTNESDTKRVSQAGWSARTAGSGHGVTAKRVKFRCDRKRSTPGSAGEEHLGFGGAALIVFNGRL